MSAATTPIFPIVPQNGRAQFTSADTTAKKTLFTAGANGSRVEAISVCTNDTTAVNLAFYIGDGSTDFYIGVVNIPIGSGYTTVVKVDALTTLAGANFKALVLAGGYLLKVNCVATMTAAKTTDILVTHGDY